MNDWQLLVIEELKAINRKLEDLSDKVDADVKHVEDKVYGLEDKIEKKLEPLNAHMIRSNFAVVIVGALASVVAAAGILPRIW
jgi:hypothetical protein